jgi:hypothetical protein
MASIYKTRATGALAVAVSIAAPVGHPRWLRSVTVHLSAAPTTAGSLTITLDAVGGAVYDTLLATESMVGVTDYVWQPPEPLLFIGGDEIDVAYQNPDGRTYGVEIVTEAA